jgi:hypothetical protein
MIVEVPITADPAQKFITQLGELNFVFDIQWNDRSSQFSLTLSNDDTDLTYFTGVPLVLGTDLLDPYNYDVGSLVLVDTSNGNTEATVEDFGDRVKLYWYSPDEVENAINAAV